MMGRRAFHGMAVSAMIACASANAFAGGGDTALEVCAACHGTNGISVAPDIPNLAGQRAKYLEKQLKAFRAGDRSNDIMNAVAEQLDDEAIGQLAAFFASLPGAEGEDTSALLPGIAETKVSFPADYAETFTYYMTIDFPKKKQIRRYFANPTAVLAAKKGGPMPLGAYFLVEVSKAKEDDAGKLVEGAEGQLEPDGIVFYTAMATGENWGAAFPEILRNGDWNYAVFSKDMDLKPDVNQALCLACHKPLKEDSYLFSLSTLQEALGE